MMDRFKSSGDFYEFPASMLMLRKSFQFQLTNEQEEVVQARQTQLLASRSGGTVRGPISEEYDRYWAREHALFLEMCVRPGLAYVDYLPGRYYTYQRVVDILAEHMNIGVSRFGEIGCGSGMTLMLLAKAGAQVEGVDISVSALMFLHDLARSYDVTVQTNCRSFFETGYPTGHFFCSFNLGVVEHLAENDRVRLIAEISRITTDLVAIFVPNFRSPIYQMMDALEYQRMPPGQVFASHESAQDICLEATCTSLGLSIVDHGAIHVVPPAEIPGRFLSARAKEFFDSIPRFEAANGLEKVAKWRTIEAGLPRGLVEEFGWFKYAVCKLR